MKQTALITGASSGIGLELAKIFASKGINLVLVARSIEKLENLKTEIEKDFSISVLNIPQDLSVPNSAQNIFKKVQQNNIEINYLVNNAGVGVFGKHLQTSWEEEQKMIQLNITSLVEITKLFIHGMVERKEGKIMNVASVAAFVPGPYMSVYFASKAFVLSYSEALRSELINTGISITTLCPGATRTNFFDTSPNIKKNNLQLNFPSAKEVANYGFDSMWNKKNIAVHGFINQLTVAIVKFLPRDIVLSVTKKLSSKF